MIDKNYLPNYTAGLTFFIAVAATNLFHQGNWQRVFSAKNNSILKYGATQGARLKMTVTA